MSILLEFVQCGQKKNALRLISLLISLLLLLFTSNLFAVQPDCMQYCHAFTGDFGCDIADCQPFGCEWVSSTEVACHYNCTIVPKCDGCCWA